MATTITGSGVDNIVDGTITNADINASAAIAGSKVDGSFGKVLQVVSREESTWTSSSGTTPVSLNLGATITPTSLNNKLLFLVNINGVYSPSTSMSIKLEIHKDGTLKKFIDNDLTHNISAYGESGSYNFLMDVDSTSSQTWDVFGNSSTGGTWGWCNYIAANERTLCTLTIMEIGA